MLRLVRVLVSVAAVAAVPACALEVEDPVDEDSAESRELALTAEGDRSAAAPGHCVSRALPAGRGGEAAPLVCFKTFAGAISHATGGLVQLPSDATSVTQKELDAGYAPAARNGIAAASVVIGISYWDTDFDDWSWVHTAPSGCDSDLSVEWQLAFVGSGWNDKIGSAEGYSQCEGIYFEHANFTGAQVVTTWNGGPMDDEASSIQWR